MRNDATRPGYLTTEFWVVILTQLWSAVALFGGWDVNSAKANAAIKVAALAGAALAAGWYAHARAKAKAAIR